MPLSLFQLEPLLRLALAEDLAQGDLTSDNLPLAVQEQLVQLAVVARSACVVSGLPVAAALCQLVDPGLNWRPLLTGGATCQSGQTLALLNGPHGSVLKVERTLLNFLQHLSGVATTTRRFVEVVAGTSTRIAHTRKTTPGLRLLEVQAVIDGGGYPHRFNLGQAAMVKDNHWQGSGQSLPELARHIKANLSHAARLIVEVETLEQIEPALAAGAEVLLLDNFLPETVTTARELIGGRAVIEVSGGITLETAAAYARAGADILSTSAITLGAPAVDLGLDVLSS